jgi:hypothetical protein
MQAASMTTHEGSGTLRLPGAFDLGDSPSYLTQHSLLYTFSNPMAR